MNTPLMVDKGFLTLEGLVANRAVEVIKRDGLFLLFLPFILLTILQDPVSLLNLQSPLQPMLSLLLPPAIHTRTLVTLLTLSIPSRDRFMQGKSRSIVTVWFGYACMQHA